MTATVAEVAAGIRKRDRRSLARLLTWIEMDDPRGLEASAALDPPSRAPLAIGVTGPPGAGKSTLVSRLVVSARAEGDRVGVLAVDPSSPLTGGALLGDRIRMIDHLHDDGVFIRSMASRGQLGGLAAAVPSALRAMEAFAFDWLIVETVGVGQVEAAIVDQADVTVLVVAPGWGDDIQASKAGLLEIADVIVVNKADRPGARDAATDLRDALELSKERLAAPRVELCSATTGEGIADVRQAIRDRVARREDGGVERRRRLRRIRGLRSVVRELALARADEALDAPAAAAVADAVGEGRADPRAAAQEILARELSPGSPAP